MIASAGAGMRIAVTGRSSSGCRSAPIMCATERPARGMVDRRGCHHRPLSMPARLPRLAIRPPFLPRPARHLRKTRLRLGDGAETTLYLATYDAREVEVGVVQLERPTPLEHWCRARGHAEAIVGGFYVRPHGTPLGELRTHGVLRTHTPFDPPYAAVRACVHVVGGELRLARRNELADDPPGDLLQAGPLLLAGGERVADDDHEGFSAGADQFDSDITSGRYPRAALATDGTRIIAVACDGRADDEAGLTFAELADALRERGAVDAINLDGGGSTSLVCGGRLRNRPREEHGIVLAGGRAVSTALVFRPRLR